MPPRSGGEPLHLIYWAALSVASGPASTRRPAGSRARINVHVVNAGVAPWPRAETLGPGSIRLGAQLMDRVGTPIQQDFARAELPRAIAPRESSEVPLVFRLPSTPGQYLLKIDLLQEQVCWFEERGSRPLVLDLEATDEVADSLSPGMLLARIERIRPESATVHSAPRGPIAIHVRATNLGNTLWRIAEDGRHGHVRLGAKLVAPDGDRDYWRAPLPSEVPPGGTADVQASMPAPTTPGEYTVVLDLVDEGIAWFEEDGSRVARFSLRVAAGSESGLTS